MANMKSFLAGVRALFRKAKDDADLDDELRDYLEAAVAEKVKAGMNSEEARRPHDEEESKLHSNRGLNAGAGHGREHGHLQRG